MAPRNIYLVYFLYMGRYLLYFPPPRRHPYTPRTTLSVGYYYAELSSVALAAGRGFLRRVLLWFAFFRGWAWTALL